MPARSLQETEFDGARGDSRTRVAGGDHGIAVAVLHEINGETHGGIFLLSHGGETALLHGDHIRGMDNLQPAVGAYPCRIARLAQYRFIAHHEERVQTLQPAQHEFRSVDIDLRGVVAAHCIQR